MPSWPSAETQRRERQAAAQGSDPRPVDDCDWCGPEKKPGDKGAKRCPTCLDLEENHGWSAKTYACGKVSFKKEGQKQLSTTVGFITDSTQDLLAAAPANDRDGSQGGGKMPAGEGEKGDTSEDEEEEEEVEPKKAGEGKKRDLEDDSDDEEGEGKQKSVNAGVAFSVVAGDDGRQSITLEGDDELCAQLGVVSYSMWQFHLKDLVENEGCTREQARAKMLELFTTIADRTALHRQAMMLEFALEDAGEFERSEVGPKVEEIKGKIEEARAAIAEIDGRLETLRSWPSMPEIVQLENRYVADADGKREEIAGDEEKTKRLKRSVPEKFDELVEAGKKTFKVSHGTPEKAKGLYFGVRANKATWNLDRSLGNAILDGVVSELPQQCCFELDEYQKTIILESPPLLLESGSGTGKTNVLFEHAVRYARDVRVYSDVRELKHWEKVCFVTVSKRLKDDLESRYATVTDIKEGSAHDGDAAKEERVTLPIHFYSLKELLCDLLSIDLKEFKLCDFNGYVSARTSHQSIIVDAKEAENEIGGVIMGSLDAAFAGRALTREEYLLTGRSYVARDDAGMQTRRDIYSEFEQYTKWKLSNGKRDINDVVLELVVSLKVAHQKQAAQFQALYLDEIQDFSYATTYLLCSIAGHADCHWVFAGDTAQMISPGCSFKFSGLKDVLLTIKPGIESLVKEVVRLERNYRVTKDVLLFANCILKEANKSFRNDIRYFAPDVAVNDHGTKVRICKWDDALGVNPVKFGADQALIYSSDSSDSELEQDLKEWLTYPDGDGFFTHPLIMTPLESKGLEFTDVVVAFDIDRRAWSMKAGVKSLMMMRSLYVACTRPKRRVVVLIRGSDRREPEMKRFFLNLEDYDIEESDAEVALLEFNKETTRNEWLAKGMALFADEQYKLAASCFSAAKDLGVGFMNWAQGLLEEEQENIESARDSFRRSAHAFFERADYERTLTLLVKVKERPPWNPDDDHIYEYSIAALPDFFPRDQVIEFALLRNRWQEISVDDVKGSLPFFLEHRERDELQQIVASCPKDDLSELGILGADQYFAQRDYFDATRLYLEQSHEYKQDFAKAGEATDRLIGGGKSQESLDEIAQLWKWSKGESPSESVSSDGNTFLLLRLYENPLEVAKSRRSAEAMRKFGTAVIMSAFDRANAPKEELHRFSHSSFAVEVEQALVARFSGNLIEVVRWYLNNDDKRNAERFAAENMHHWLKEDLPIIASMKLSPSGIVEAADSKGALIDLVRIYLSDKAFNLQMATQASDRALASAKQVHLLYVVDLINEWGKRANDKRVKRMVERKQPSPPGPKTVVLLRLFWEPEQSSRQLHGYCMDWFGSLIVKTAVSRSIDDAQKRYEVLSRFDAQAFEHLRPPPAEEQGVQHDSTRFRQADKVILHGLASARARALNGRTGTILGWLQNEQRYGVRLDDGVEKSVRASNLRLDDDSSGSSIDGNDDDGDSDGTISISSDESSSSGSVPELIGRRSKSESSASSSEGDSSDSSFHRANDSDSSSSSVPPLARKDNSSSDEDDIPQLLSPNQQSSSSSSDESIPGRRLRRRAAQGRGGRSGRSEGEGRGRGRGGAGTAKGAGKGKGRKKRK